ncbi:hypothetical protein HPB48_020574 [Haemaphysalis longicornis]|uniref:Uncharacterized protein n=1 Tax=Haemaphysalis longicornis TaxID=44386 RepID=A0A9J6GP99_HAELO|nr:hypothetical protein HPB48_020574 [Haemaphysalis longicornis]
MRTRLILELTSPASPPRSSQRNNILNRLADPPALGQLAVAQPPLPLQLGQRLGPRRQKRGHGAHDAVAQVVDQGTLNNTDRTSRRVDQRHSHVPRHVPGAGIEDFDELVQVLGRLDDDRRISRDGGVVVEERRQESGPAPLQSRKNEGNVKTK